MFAYGMDLVMGVLGVVCMLILFWIIMIHLRVNRLKHELDKLEKMAKGK